MKEKNDKFSIELIDSEESFFALRNEWDDLIEKSTNPSFYSTFLFVSITWKYFRNETDALCILVVRRDSAIVGIAPFRIGKISVGNIRLLRGIKAKIIRFIAEWGCGDKPAIITTEKPEEIWDCIFQFLSKDFTQWDGIWLVEQPENSPVLKVKMIRKLLFNVTIIPDVTSYNIILSGSWETFLKTLGKNTYRTWNNSKNKLYNLPEKVNFFCFEDPESVSGALKRFIDIEQSGWKKNQSFSVGGNEKNKIFYEELVVQLAWKKMVAIYLLTLGTTDIAGMIVFKLKNTVYGAHVTYSSTYARYSPGVILNAEIIKTLFGTHYKEYDYLGIQEDNEKNSLKKKWSTGNRQNVTIMITKQNIPMWLYWNGSKLKRFLRNSMKKMSG